MSSKQAVKTNETKTIVDKVSKILDNSDVQLKYVKEDAKISDVQIKMNLELNDIKSLASKIQGFSADKADKVRKFESEIINSEHVMERRGILQLINSRNDKKYDQVIGQVLEQRGITQSEAITPRKQLETLSESLEHPEKVHVKIFNKFFPHGLHPKKDAEGNLVPRKPEDLKSGVGCNYTKVVPSNFEELIKYVQDDTDKAVIYKKIQTGMKYKDPSGRSPLHEEFVKGIHNEKVSKEIASDEKRTRVIEVMKDTKTFLDYLECAKDKCYMTEGSKETRKEIDVTNRFDAYVKDVVKRIRDFDDKLERLSGDLNKALKALKPGKLDDEGIEKAEYVLLMKTLVSLIELFNSTFDYETDNEVKSFMNDCRNLLKFDLKLALKTKTALKNYYVSQRDEAATEVVVQEGFKGYMENINPKGIVDDGIYADIAKVLLGEQASNCAKEHRVALGLIVVDHILRKIELLKAKYYKRQKLIVYIQE